MRSVRAGIHEYVSMLAELEASVQSRHLRMLDNHVAMRIPPDRKHGACGPDFTRCCPDG